MNREEWHITCRRIGVLLQVMDWDRELGDEDLRDSED